MKKQTAETANLGRGLTAGELKNVVGGRGGSTIPPEYPTPTDKEFN